MASNMLTPNIKGILLARKYAYDILRRFFIEEPSKEYLRIFFGKKMHHQFPFKEEDKDIAEGISDISDYMNEFDPVKNEADFEDLHWDYTRMMVGPYLLPAPPWESVYVREDKLLFQETTLKVRKKYRKYGFTANELHIEAEDHIGLELDFMYHLNNLLLKMAGGEEQFNSEGIKEILTEQNSFLREHLLAFAPEFANKVIENADTLFYQGMAKMMKGFLQTDSKVLHELLDIENF